MVSAFGTRRCGVRYAVAAAACLLVASPARGTLISPSGQLGLGDVGNPVAEITNDINTATGFSFANFITAGRRTGFFVGLPPQAFGSVAFTVSDPLVSLQFGNAVFGTFASTSVRELSNDPIVGSRSFVFSGSYTKGSFGEAFLPNPAAAMVTLSLNQTNGTGTPITINATLEFAAQPVPEPTTLALMAMAAGTVVVVRARRRSA